MNTNNTLEINSKNSCFYESKSIHSVSLKKHQLPPIEHENSSCQHLSDEQLIQNFFNSQLVKKTIPEIEPKQIRSAINLTPEIQIPITRKFLPPLKLDYLDKSIYPSLSEPLPFPPISESPQFFQKSIRSNLSSLTKESSYQSLYNKERISHCENGEFYLPQDKPFKKPQRRHSFHAPSLILMKPISLPNHFQNESKIKRMIISNFKVEHQKKDHIFLNVRFLEIRDKYISNSDLQLISTQFPNLTTINLSFCKKINDLGLFSIANICCNLEYIDLTGCTYISNIGIDRLQENCPNLQRIDVQFCKNVSQEYQKNLSQKYPKIKENSRYNIYE